MYQYTILVQHKNGCPFHINTFDYFDVALISLNNYIKDKDDKHYRRSFYVNNSFYNNVYDNSVQNKYELFCREGKWANGNILKILILIFRCIYSSNVIY